MSAWDDFEYVIAYLDKNEMNIILVRTDREHLGEIIENIIDNGGVNVKVWRNEI